MRRSFRRRLTLQMSALALLLLLAFGLVVRTLGHRHGTRMVDGEIVAAGRAAYFGSFGRRADVLPMVPPSGAGLGSVPRLAFASYDMQGNLLQRSPGFPDGAASPPSTAVPGGPGQVIDHAYDLTFGNFTTIRVDGQRFRRAELRGPQGYLVILANGQQLTLYMRTLDIALLIALGAALALIVPIAWWQTNRAMQPMRDITTTAANISADALHERIPAQLADQEYSELIAVLNDLLARLQASFQQARRFSADAAHELRTPLTVLQGELEAEINRAELGSEQQQVFIKLLDEVEHLKVITRKLLLLSLADVGHLPLDLQETDLADLLHSLAEDIELLGPHLAVHTDIQQPLPVYIDRDLITQAIRNLFTNAVKYNHAPAPGEDDRITGCVVVQAQIQDAHVRVRVGNSGARLSAESAAHIFERFFRRDDAHSRKTAGAGLGLALVSEIVRAHGGLCYLAERAEALPDPDGGEPLTTFIILLPTQTPGETPADLRLEGRSGPPVLPRERPTQPPRHDGSMKIR